MKIITFMHFVFHGNRRYSACRGILRGRLNKFVELSTPTPITRSAQRISVEDELQEAQRIVSIANDV